MTADEITQLPTPAAIDAIGGLIDDAFNSSNEKDTILALALCDLIGRRNLSNCETILLDYFRANAWHTRQKISQNNPWGWERPETEKQIFHLRRAINNEGFNKTEPLRRSQILTNLANQLNAVGRFVDALEYWERALHITPNFGKALGNYGYCLIEYAKKHYDRDHQIYLLHKAHKKLAAATS